jgi:signal transduction histidine kinase/ActR/RegA family two-component response regulator
MHLNQESCSVPHNSRMARNPLDRFRAIVADADEGIIVLEAGSVIAYVNPAAEYLLGRNQADLAGEIFGLPLAPNADPTAINVVARDGSVRVVELQVEELQDAAAETLVVRLRDITDYDRRLADANDQVRRRDEFLAMLSHELRNPLAAIQNSAQLLCQEGLPQRFRQEASEILERQFSHMSRILDDLLDISRISRGKVALSLGPVDVLQVVRDAVEAATPLITKHGHALEIDLPAKSVWVRGDATRLGQIVVNLLNNAAKFTPEGGDLRIAVAAQGEYVEIVVADDGPGIPAELQDSIFTSFVQGAQSLDRREGGLGLGLALVKTFVELHGGTVEARTAERGTGAVFTVRLPIGCEMKDAQEGRDAAVNRGLRILLVEDNADARRPLKYLLQAEGHRVLEATTGSEGLTQLLNEEIDVALVDIGLPEISGYEVARRFRKERPGSVPRMIALTGYGRPEDEEAAAEAGFDGHMVKPVCFDTLRERLAEPLDRKS